MKLKYGSGLDGHQDTKFNMPQDANGYWRVGSEEEHIKNLEVLHGVYEWGGGVVWVGAQTRNRRPYANYPNVHAYWVCNMLCKKEDAEQVARDVLSLATLKYNWTWKGER